MEASLPTEAVVAEIRGLRETIDARFRGVDIEQKSSREWLSRLTLAIDRQTEISQKFYAYDARLAHAEATISDLSLEISGHTDRLGDIKTDTARFSMITAAYTGAATMIVGVVGTHLFDRFLLPLIAK